MDMKTDEKSVGMLGVGTDLFQVLREQNGYFVDKTMFIKRFLDNRGHVNLITRPRRFGKTINLSMLKSFFEIGTNPSLFQGLNISKESELCREHMGQYPVIFFSLKAVEGSSFEEAMDGLNTVISDVVIPFSFLLDSDQVNPYDKKRLERLQSGMADIKDLKSSLLSVTRMLYSYYKKRVIILIDEYDVPLDKARHRFQEKMLSFMRIFLGNAFKTNPYVEFAVITGCLRISKESIFTGVNNLVVDTIMDNSYAPFFGFTPDEVNRILSDYGILEERKQITAWYNGYKFGNQDIYNPWDIMNYCRDAKMNPGMLAKPYWLNSSSNEIIRELIEHSDASLHLELEQLMRGECIYRGIKQEVTYDDFGKVDTLWSILYMAGYLTAGLTDTEDPAIPLMIPNQEIKEIFSKIIYEWSIDRVKIVDCKGFQDALWAKNIEYLQKAIDQMLLDTISFYDYKEDYYHGFLAGILKAASGCTVKSNEEMGLGRSDIAILDDKKKRGILFEVKHSKSENSLVNDCKKALLQMKERKYSTDLSGLNYDLISYGIACYKKKCLILCDS